MTSQPVNVMLPGGHMGGAPMPTGTPTNMLPGGHMGGSAQTYMLGGAPMPNGVPPPKPLPGGTFTRKDNSRLILLGGYIFEFFLIGGFFLFMLIAHNNGWGFFGPVVKPTDPEFYFPENERSNGRNIKEDHDPTRLQEFRDRAKASAQVMKSNAENQGYIRSGLTNISDKFE